MSLRALQVSGSKKKKKKVSCTNLKDAATEVRPRGGAAAVCCLLLHLHCVCEASCAAADAAECSRDGDAKIAGTLRIDLCFPTGEQSCF